MEALYLHHGALLMVVVEIRIFPLIVWCWW